MPAWPSIEFQGEFLADSLSRFAAAPDEFLVVVRELEAVPDAPRRLRHAPPDRAAGGRQVGGDGGQAALGTLHDARPGVDRSRAHAGASTSRTNPACLASAEAQTASHSIGFRLHVE